MKVGVLTASFSRHAGGLFWALQSLTEALGAAGCTVHVFSGDGGFPESARLAGSNVALELLPRQGPASFGYMPRLAGALEDAELDLLHVHGIWMYPSVAASNWRRHAGRPCLITPHGMLDPWAVCNSNWKKRMAGLFYENAHLRGAACIHALCESECRSIRAYGLRNPVAVIPNGVDLPDSGPTLPGPEWIVDLPAGARVLLFLSRIHPKKGLVNLLHAWKQVRRQQPRLAEPWHLVVAGWDQGRHQAGLERLGKELGVNDSLHFVGPQFEEHKAASLARADAFVLPSFSEGLPMAVLEAWSYRLPVLMTPQCNLPEGFEAQAALRIEPKTDSIARALETFFGMNDSEREAMGERGRALVEQRFNWPGIARQMLSVYRWVLGQGDRPGCVIAD